MQLSLVTITDSYCLHGITVENGAVHEWLRKDMERAFLLQADQIVAVLRAR